MWGNASSFNGNGSSFYTHCGGGFFSAMGVPSFLYASAFLYPFIIGIHELGKVVIGKYLFGQILSNSCNFAAWHGNRFNEWAK